MVVNAVEKRSQSDVAVAAADDNAVFCGDPPLFGVSSYVETSYQIEKKSCDNWEMCSQKASP